MNDWCVNQIHAQKAWIDELIAKKITADYIAGKIAAIETLTVKTLSANKVLIGHKRGIQVATQTYVANLINDKLEDYAKKGDIPSVPTYVIVNGIRYTLH